MSRNLILDRRGDTLVEVLIAMVIVAVVLGGAYVSANNSFKGTQGAKERDIALRVGESQVERIRGFKTQRPNSPISNNSCFTSALTNVTNSGLPPLNSDNLQGSGGSYNASCIFTSTGSTYFVGANDIPYHADIEVSSNDYVIHVRWPKVGGGQNQETILRYRYY